MNTTEMSIGEAVEVLREWNRENVNDPSVGLYCDKEMAEAIYIVTKALSKENTKRKDTLELINQYIKDLELLKRYMETGLSPEEVIDLRDTFFEAKEAIEERREETKVRICYSCPSCGREVWGHRCEECGQKIVYKDEKEEE